MKDVIGLIISSGESFSMRELTARRSITALPVAARYRLVDFLLSNLVNSGIRKVGLLTQGSYSSLMDHVGSGKEWNLHTRNNGLYVLPTVNNRGAYTGVLEALRANTEFLRRSSQEYVLIAGGRVLYNTVYDEMQDFHIANNADITVMYTKFDPLSCDYSADPANVRAFVNVNGEGRLTDMEINPNVISCPNVLMDVILVKRTLIMHLVDYAAARGYREMYRDLLRPAVYDESLRILGYEFKGYCRRMETINSYFNMNMDLLSPDVRRDLFETNPVYTKTRDDAPSRYLPGGSVKNSLLADGCVIEGSVENSVLFRGVHVSKGAVVKNAIIMQDSFIGEDVELDNVILDKHVTLLKGGRFIGMKHYPIVLGKNITV